MRFRTIAFKLFLHFGVVLVVFGLMITLMQNLFLSSVQTNHAKDLLSSTAQGIFRSLESKGVGLDQVASQPEVAQLLDTQALEKNVQIIVFGKITAGGAIYNTIKQDPNEVMDTARKQGTDKVGGTFYTKHATAGDSQIAFMSYEIKDTGSGYTLELRTHTSVLQENVYVTQLFNRLVIVIAIVLSLVWAFLFARIFTQPIVSINTVTRNMSELNFDTKLNIYRSDELGELAESINVLGERLNSAITELQVKNEQLTHELEREKDLESMRKKFVSDVSHELKTPIAIIQGFAESLKLSVNKSPDKRENYCNIIMDETAKMTRLVHGLLDLSQYSSGVFEINRGDISIDKLIASVADKFAPIATQNGAVLTYTAEPYTLSADELRIEQVLSNYTNNAVSHADGKRQIIIEGKKLLAENYYRVSVFNNGSAINDEDLSKVWTPFYKADKSRNRGEGRYGIGLSIVQALIEHHNGRFGVQNVTGGVEFYFDLPIDNS